MRVRYIILAALLALLAALPVQANRPGDIMGDVLNSDIRVFINGVEIRGYNIGGWTYVIAEDLRAYGVVVRWDEERRVLTLRQGESSREAAPVPANENLSGSVAFPFFYTDIVTYIDGQRVASYNIGGRTAVRVDDVAAAFGQIAWDEERRELYASTDGAPPRRFVPQSSIRLPDRRLTDSEREAWIADYRAHGGAVIAELEVVRLVNIERGRHGLALVEPDDRLMMAARFFAQQAHDLWGLHSGAHNFGPYADDPSARHGASANVAEAFGARLRWNGGNWFSSGSMAPEALVSGWMDSEGHRRYILSPEHRFIGVGQFPGGISYMFLSEYGG